MGRQDAERWDARYREALPPTSLAPHPIVQLAISTAGRPPATMLDIACGLGDDGLTVARQGAQVLFLDVSAVALTHVTSRAEELGIAATTQIFDSETDPIPTGPWELMSCVHYLDRGLLQRAGTALAPGGMLAAAIATVTNLERHERPSMRFLLEPGELPALVTTVPELTVVHHDEDWRENGTHEAWVIATR